MEDRVCVCVCECAGLCVRMCVCVCLQSRPTKNVSARGRLWEPPPMSPVFARAESRAEPSQASGKDAGPCPGAKAGGRPGGHGHSLWPPAEIGKQWPVSSVRVRVCVCWLPAAGQEARQPSAVLLLGKSIGEISLGKFLNILSPSVL